MPPTTWRYSESIIAWVDSRWALVKPASVARLKAVLYSQRRSSCGRISNSSNAWRRNGCSVISPVNPTLPDGCSQISPKALAR